MIHRFNLPGDAAAHEFFGPELPSVAAYNQDSDDIKMARSMAEEAVNASGASVEVSRRTDNADHDGVWDADADPTYWAPVIMRATFKQEAPEAELLKWGRDRPTATEMTFSHLGVYKKFGDRMLRSGDVIKAPEPSSVTGTVTGYRFFRITEVVPSGAYKFQWLYITCHVEALTGDVTVDPERRAQHADLAPPLGLQWGQ